MASKSVDEALAGLGPEIQAAMAVLGQQNQNLSVYDQVLAEFTGVPTSPLSRLVATSGTMAAFHETDPSKLRAEEFFRTESPTGKILFRNGVIADPMSGQVIYPPTKGEANEIRGSEQWLLKIQKQWSEEEANKWRKKLISWGYDLQGQLAPGGGMALDLITALRDYHNTIYLNYGKPIKMRPGGTARRQIRKEVDMASIRANAAQWFEVLGLPDASDAEKDWIADRVIDSAIELVRSGLPVASAVSKASNMELERFTETPVAEEAIEVSRKQETSTAFREKLIGVGQLSSM